MKKIERILLLAFVIISIFGVFNVYAQDTLTVDFKGEKEAVNTYMGSDINEDNSATNSITQLTTQAAVITSKFVPSLFANEQELDSMSNENSRGIIGMMDDSINFVYQTSPNIDLYAHLSEEWIPGYDQSQSGIYAASKDSGYQSLMNSGIADVWSAVRNLSYIFFIIIMLVAGFMIMFRHKVGGQALVTLGNALPNIIMALILVTFSFAIAGLIIDLGGVFMVVVQDILGLDEYVAVHDIGSLIGQFFSNSARNAAFQFAGGTALATVVVGVVVALSSGPIGWIVAGSVGLLGLLIILGIVGVVFWGSIIVFITLVKAYIGIIFNVLIAPLQLAFSAIPGNQKMIQTWINNLLRNVLTFPVVFFIMNVPLAMASAPNLNLGFPEKLVYIDSLADLNDVNPTAAIFIFIFQIFVYFYAAQVPKYLEAIFPPSTPKAIQEGLAAAKGGLAKIPLIGGIFK